MSDELIPPMNNAISSGRSVQQQHFSTGDVHEGHGAEKTESFKNVLDHYMGEAAAPHEQASGHIDVMHKVAAAMQDADSTYKLMMEIHNKLLDAYHDLNNMK
jgi:flagellar hook-basal body complex protein FliE